MRMPLRTLRGSVPTPSAPGRLWSATGVWPAATAAAWNARGYSPSSARLSRETEIGPTSAVPVVGEVGVGLHRAEHRQQLVE